MSAARTARTALPGQAVILAAGEGVRLRPLTLDCPKPMLPVGGRPLLEHLIVLLRDQGIREIAVNLHYRGEAIQAYCGDGSRWGVVLRYSPEETLLGSAGALLRLRDFPTGTFVVLYGDLYTDVDIRALTAFHRRRRADLTIALHEAEDPTREGIIATEPGAGRVTRFVEKPAAEAVFTRQANAGVFVMEPAVLAAIPAEPLSGAPAPFDIGHDLIPALLRDGARVFATPLRGFVLDIGSPERYEEANARELARRDHAALHRDEVSHATL